MTPVLMVLGDVMFEGVHFLSGATFEGETQFAEHKVLGGRPQYEFTNQGSKERTVKGTIHPLDEDFGYGNDIIGALDKMRMEGEPQHFMRGDGTVWGWHIVTKVKVDGEYLNAEGIPHKIEFTISLTNCTAPAVTETETVEITVEYF